MRDSFQIFPHPTKQRMSESHAHRLVVDEGFSHPSPIAKHSLKKKRKEKRAQQEEALPKENNRQESQNFTLIGVVHRRVHR